MDYKLKLPEGSKIHPAFHVSCLKKQVGTDIAVQPMLPYPLEDGLAQHVPEGILARRVYKKGKATGVQLLVQWLVQSGFGDFEMLDAGPVTPQQKVAIFRNGIAVCSGCSDYRGILFMNTKTMEDDIIVDPVESPEIVDDPFQTMEEHGGVCFGWEFIPQGKLSYILDGLNCDLSFKAEHRTENIGRIGIRGIWIRHIEKPKVGPRVSLHAPPQGGGLEGHAPLHMAADSPDSSENSTTPNIPKFYKNEDLNERNNFHRWAKVQFGQEVA
ncbi:hypothetical protein D8674_012818 [Pyrus ussuriensis x Pyrus communis]|uniref:Uncharacterized protein n=1 Tax=Pyrus ussuriensis x Pyrus communis TaxID=2448454 RepID=A0A5N5GN26_9ROSA|nr:hypothetical protein D8674_012818 [Pyrus ussuriensis x Pyrus communis]